LDNAGICASVPSPVPLAPLLYNYPLGQEEIAANRSFSWYYPKQPNLCSTRASQQATIIGYLTGKDTPKMYFRIKDRDNNNPKVIDDRAKRRRRKVGANFGLLSFSPVSF